MIKFKLPKKNQVALKAGIERELDERRDDVYKIINGMITDIYNDAIKRLQQFSNTGNLAGGLEKVHPTKSKVQGEVFNSIDYAPFVEFGTKSKVFNSPLISPELKKFARQFKGTGGGDFKDLQERIGEWARLRGIADPNKDPGTIYVIARSVAREGIDAKPTLYPSFDKARFKAIQKLRQIK